MKDERFVRLINLVKEKNIKFDIALIFGRLEVGREIIIKLLEENKLEIAKNLEKIVEVEREFTKFNLLIDLSSPLAFQIGKEIFEKARKIRILYELQFNQLLFSLLDEDLEKINENIEKLNSFKEELRKVIDELLEKIK